MDFEGFDWDAGNREKCCKHGVSVREIEALFRGRPSVEPDLAHSALEYPFRAIGQVNVRWLFVVFTLRDRGGLTLLRPISARYMHLKEIAAYGKRNS